MADIYSSAEQFWDAILSRDPDLVQAAFRSLDQASRREVLTHLRAMATEEGWQPQQTASARAALDAIQKDPEFHE